MTQWQEHAERRGQHGQSIRGLGISWIAETWTEAGESVQSDRTGGDRRG
jgi:hypothetical protein